MLVHNTHCKVTGTATVKNLDGTITIEPISESIREMLFDGNSSLTELKLDAMFPSVIDRTENVKYVLGVTFRIQETIKSYKSGDPDMIAGQTNIQFYSCRLPGLYTEFMDKFLTELIQSGIVEV